MSLTQSTQYSSAYEKYKVLWLAKTTKQLEKEIVSMRAYLQKHSQAYAWHGSSMTAPGTLADGDKLNALREIIEERGN